MQFITGEIRCVTIRVDDKGILNYKILIMFFYLNECYFSQL